MVFYNLNRNGQPPAYVNEKGQKRWIHIKNHQCHLYEAEDIKYAEELLAAGKGGFVTYQKYLEHVTPESAFLKMENEDGTETKVPVSEAIRLVKFALSKGETIHDVKYEPAPDEKYVKGTATGATIKELKKETK